MSPPGFESLVIAKGCEFRVTTALGVVVSGA